MRVVLLVTMFFVFLLPSNVMALSCVEPPSIEEAYEKYDGVIMGQVEDVTWNKQSNQIKLKVIKSYKGIDENSLLIEENITWGSLWGPSEVGKEYLYFLRQTESGWENPLCSPTKKVADTSDELRYLKDKEITLKTVPDTTEPPSDNMKHIEPIVSDEVNKDDPSPSTNWTVIILIGAALLIVLGIVIFRLVRRGK